MARSRSIRRFEDRGPVSSMELVSHLVESPGLIRALRELPPPVLGKLIDSIGLESAGDVVALATTEQLSAVFDEDLWSVRDGAVEERFDSARFALWLRVLFEAGEQAVVDRLTALSDDLLTLVIARLVLVIDIDALGIEMSEAGEDLEWTEKALEGCLFEEWEEFRLISRDPNAWDVVWEAILALDREDHELVRRLLERCAAISSEFIDDNGGLYAVLTSDEMLEGDARAERDDRRAAKGYVSAADARAFLELAKRGEGPQDDRDAITRAYFRELVRDTKKAPSAKRSSAADRRHRAELIARLEAARVIDKAVTRPVAGLLGSGGKRAGEAGLSPGRALLESTLASLGEQSPTVYAERLEELGYLANVLVSGLGTRDRKLRPVDALEISFELVGFELARRAAERGAAPALEIVTRTPADRLFRPAYRVLFERREAPEIARIRELLERGLGEFH